MLQETALIAAAAAALVTILFIGIALAIGLQIFGGKWDGRVYDPKGCIKIEQIGDYNYAVNDCTGVIEEISGTQSRYVLN